MRRRSNHWNVPVKPAAFPSATGSLIGKPKRAKPPFDSQYARNGARSFNDLIMQSLTRELPLLAEPDLPPSVQAELDAMEHLSNEALWIIARSVANKDKIALYDLLVDRQNAGSLTAEGRSMLNQLRNAADALMVRKAHAYVILRHRGHTLPTVDELHTQAT